MAGKKLQGQVAIVTGGGRGIGAATGEMLARAGAAVVLVARTEAEVESVAARLRDEKLSAIALAGDIGDPDFVEEIVESAVDQFGRVDILINNAGVVWPLEPIAFSDPDEWTYGLTVNLIGPYYMARNVLPLMLDQGYGRIVNVTCGLGNEPFAGASAYAVAKAGLRTLTQALIVELAESRVSVFSFDPGEVDTELQADIRTVDPEEFGIDTARFHASFENGLLRPVDEAARALYWLVGPWSGRERSGHFSMADETWRARVLNDIA